MDIWNYKLSELVEKNYLPKLDMSNFEGEFERTNDQLKMNGLRRLFTLGIKSQQVESTENDGLMALVDKLPGMQLKPEANWYVKFTGGVLIVASSSLDETVLMMFDVFVKNTVDTAVIFFPTSSTTISFDLGSFKWDWSAFKQLIITMNNLNQVGLSIVRQRTLVDTFTEFKLMTRSKVCQMHLRDNTNYSGCRPDPADQKKALSLISSSGIHYYTHGPYMTNLCSTEWNKRGFTLLITDLEITRSIGGKGVIVHVGKAVKLSPAVGLANMELSVRHALRSATADTPLILETPAGQGTELCVTYEQFSAFYLKFSDDERKRFKVCVDTCHVFAAGYNPLVYITRWVTDHGVDSLSLIHLNDSKTPLNSRKDQHAAMGTGHIGSEVLQSVIDFAVSSHIDLVFES